MQRFVLDTNVLVSGILSEQGPPGWIVDLVAPGELQVVFDSGILAEYREVLARSELNLNPARVESLLAVITDLGLLVTALPWPTALPDPDDEPFLACAMAIAAPLVTGNLRHFPEDCRFGVSVLSPRQFLDLLRS